MSQKLLGAHSPASGYRYYPAYFNASLDGDEVVLTIRAPETLIDGSHVCGFARDKGQAGRCTPGDDLCNNYCNMAPEKGPMQDHPTPWTGSHCGASASVRIPFGHFRALLREIILESARQSGHGLALVDAFQEPQPHSAMTVEGR